MLKEIRDWVKKSAAQVFTWPNRYKAEHLHEPMTPAGEYVSPETSLQCSAVASCVRLISDAIAGLPVHVYSDADGSKELAPDNPVYTLLHDQPNSLQTAYTWKQQAMAHVLLHGNSYNVIERDAAGNIKALWPLMPYGVTVEIADGTIKYRYFYAGRQDIYAASEILHFRGLTLDGVVGMSVISMARQGIGVALAEQKYAGSLLRNQARPSMQLEVPLGTKLSKEARENLRESYKKIGSGAHNAGSVVVMEEGLKLSPLSINPSDAQFIDLRKFSVIEIARWFRVPPTLIGDMERVSYSSSESEMQLFNSQTLLPWVANFESEINSKLFPARTKFSAKFDANAYIRGDQASRYSAYSAGLMAGFLTVADVRRAEGLPFIDGTEGLNRPANVIPNTGKANGPELPTP